MARMHHCMPRRVVPRPPRSSGLPRPVIVHPWQSLICLTVSVIPTFPDCHSIRTTWCAAFSLWPLHEAIRRDDSSTPSRGLTVPPCSAPDSTPLPARAGLVGPAPAEGHLGCARALAVMDKAAINVHMHETSCARKCSASLGDYRGAWLLGRAAVQDEAVLRRRKPPKPSPSPLTTLHPPSSSRGSRGSTFPPALDGAGPCVVSALGLGPPRVSCCPPASDPVPSEPQGPMLSERLPCLPRLSVPATRQRLRSPLN